MWSYPPASASLLNTIRKRICQTDTASLITIGPEGYPRARAMADLNVETDFVFRFATPLSSRKISEIRANPHMAVSYLEPASKDYVCVFGRGEIVMDDAARASFWRPDWERYWPQGRTDPDYAIVRVVGEAIEYFDMEQDRLIKVALPTGT